MLSEEEPFSTKTKLVNFKITPWLANLGMVASRLEPNGSILSINIRYLVDIQLSNLFIAIKYYGSKYLSQKWKILITIVTCKIHSTLFWYLCSYLLNQLVSFQPLQVLFYLKQLLFKFISLWSLSTFSKKSSILTLVAKFVCFNIAENFSAVSFVNSSVLIYWLLRSWSVFLQKFQYLFA